MRRISRRHTGRAEAHPSAGGQTGTWHLYHKLLGQNALQVSSWPTYGLVAGRNWLKCEVEGLRLLYEARETRLRRLIGLEQPEMAVALTAEQKALVEGFAAMLKQQGILLDALLRPTETR